MAMPGKKKLLETTLTGLLFVAITLAAVIWIAPQFGWQFGKVASSSMEPSISVGSVVVAKSIDTGTLEVGDVIVFSKTEKHRIVHRIVGIGPQGFRTKGDANEDPDPFIVPPEAVLGKAVYDVPYLGYVADSLKSTWGFVLLLVLPALIVIGREVLNIWRTTKEMSGAEAGSPPSVPKASASNAKQRRPQAQSMPSADPYACRRLKVKPYEKRPRYEPAPPPLPKPRWSFLKWRSKKEVNLTRTRSLKDIVPPHGKKG